VADWLRDEHTIRRSCRGIDWKKRRAALGGELCALS
jgi:hypothetical protein